MRSVDQNVLSILDNATFYDMSKSAPLINEPQVLGAMYKTYAGAYKELNGAIYWSNGKPIVSVKYSLWTGFDTPSSIASALNSAPTDPYNNLGSYSVVNVHPWETDAMASVNTTISSLNSHVQVVTLEELLTYMRNGYGASHGQKAVRQVYYWDRNGTTAGAGTNPVGTWGSDIAWNGSADGTGTLLAWPVNSVDFFCRRHRCNRKLHGQRKRHPAGHRVGV